MRKRIVHIFILLVLFFGAQAQKQYSFLQVNNADGLVNNQVTCIHKDAKGFIWIGTLAGLSRYDGNSFINYKHNDSDSTSIIDNYILSIQEDEGENLWIETTLGYTVYDTHKEKFYRNIQGYLGKHAANINIENVYADNANQFWVRAYNQMYYQRFDWENRSLEDVFPEAEDEGRFAIDFLHAGNEYYYIFNDGAIECYNDSTYELSFTNHFLENKLGVDSLSARLFVDAEKDIWYYGNNQGIYHYNQLSRQWKHYSVNSSDVQLTSNLIRSIIQDDKGLIWVATDHGGIDIINKFSGGVTTLFHQPDNEKSIAQNTITALYIDNNNVVWVGTYKNGLSYYHESIHKFPHYKHFLSDKNSLPYSDVNCFTEDKKGNLWIGTNGGGLIYFDRKNNRFKSYRYDKDNPNSLSSNVIVGLFIDSEEILWVGTFAGGLNRFDGKRFVGYKSGEGSGHGLINNNIWSIIEDDQQNLLIGSLGGGVMRYDRKSDSFSALTNKGLIDLPTPFVNKICKLADGNLLIGTANGIVFYNVEEQRYKYHPTSNRSEPFPIGNKTIYDVFEDSRGLLWVASREGLYVFDPDTDFIKYFNDDDGFSQDIVNCIREDESKKIWISKSSGLSRIVVNESLPDKGYSFLSYDYTEEDGLQGKEFNPNASYKTSNNELIFGGANGFNLFYPNDIKYNNVLPKVVLTDFRVYNQSISPDSKGQNIKLLESSVASTEKIVIKHSMNLITIDFTALDFFIPEKIRYKYKLEGFNDKWLLLGKNKHQVTYTNLNPGDYFFKVKAANNDGIWNEEYAKLHIKVLPPFYATPLAYFLYGVIIIFILIYFRYSMLRKERIKFEMEQERIQTKRNHEMDEMKLKFLTNVSHEFRTPLTLILTPLQKLMGEIQNGSQRKSLEVIERNARQLLELVNQLLDFRKLELHGLKYNPSYGNIVAFLQEVIDNFEEAFGKKNIDLRFVSDEEQLMINFDRDKLQKVMMNLLSNALKFTQEKGTVTLELKVDTNKQMVMISVSDNGIGIRKEDIDKVFVRFYQSENNKKLGLSGSGIGLNLAREMVLLHKGTIRVESEEGQGATFTVALPVDTQVDDVRDTVEELQKDESIGTEDQLPASGEKQTVLLVEDNLDFRTFMKETFENQFQVYEAGDGQIAYDLVHQVMPDLIISDVMMPNVDGLELCQMLRKDIRTSHIPLILLTARTADEDKIKGLENGADDYITKPFNMELLMLRVNKLLELRSKQQKQFQKTIDIKPGEVQITSMDEKLIKKAIELVEKNIAEAGFSVEDMSKELGMSRVYLYKKMVAITGKSPIEFIRIIRLKRGAQLLEKSQMNISEVAYEVGFNSPRLFSKYFKEEYGMLPTAYVKEKSKE